MTFTDAEHDLITRCKNASLDGSLNFGQIVGRLAAGGIESYHADFRAGVTTYYLRSGEACTLALPLPDVALGEDFDAGAVQDCIRASQRGALAYPEFIRHTRAAGCVGYHVWIAGRQVQYLGRRGEQHVERFPD